MNNKTAYDWCLEANIRILDLAENKETWYYTTPTSKEDFLWFIGQQKVKPNSTPRKTEMYLEYRMYFMVPYNISGRQAGIQALHAVVEYQQNVRGMGKVEDLYNLWATKWKTVIVCNGGTTNNDPQDMWYGTMQQKRDQLSEMGIPYSEFHEPDMNNAMSAVAFLVDERVFLDELYPNYVDMPTPWKDKPRGYRPKEEEVAKWEAENAKNREKWVEKIGGPKNDFLRTFCNKHTLRLANN